MIIKSGIPEAMVDLLRTGLTNRGEKPLLASLGMLAEASQDIQTNAVKMGVLAPISDIFASQNSHLQVLGEGIIKYIYKIII
jgi:hypothetical protein